MAVELYSEKAEKSLLGLLISKPNLTRQVAGKITADNFFFKDNGTIFQAIVNTIEKIDTADSVLILEELAVLSDKSRDEWSKYISVLLLEKGIESNIEKYVDVISEKHQTRELETSLRESVDMVGQGATSVAELIGRVEAKISDVTKNKELHDFEDVNTLTEEFQLKLKKMGEDGYQEGIRTRITALDQKIGGLKEGEFIIVAARPSMGKTAFALEIAKEVSKVKNVGFFSLEMPAEQLIRRMLTSESLVAQDVFTKAAQQSQITNARVQASLDTIRGLHLWIDDSASLKIAELTWKARKLADLHGLDMIIIDYLQLIDSDAKNADNRQQAISDISRQLKALARDLKIPVIALSQLSRRVESREDKRPQMSDIRESGAIEQDADIIMFLYREDYYKHKEDDNEHGKKPWSELEVIISKHRNGPTGIVKLGLDLAHGKVTTLHTTYNKG